jgi:hypothetical protein
MMLRFIESPAAEIFRLRLVESDPLAYEPSPGQAKLIFSRPKQNVWQHGLGSGRYLNAVDEADAPNPAGSSRICAAKSRRQHYFDHHRRLAARSWAGPSYYGHGGKLYQEDINVR